MKIAKLLLFLFLLVAAERFSHSQTDGFMVSKILSDLPEDDPRWKSAPLTHSQREEMEHILDQPFFYLGGGHESYAFVSQDGQFVLKFFKHQTVRLSFLKTALVSKGHFFAQLQKARSERLDRTFTSCMIAYQQLPKETGLLFLHLNREEKIGKSVWIQDRLGIRHSIDLDQTEFVIQKKADLARERLSKLLAYGETPALREAIDSLLSLLYRRAMSGIYDRDVRILDNFGFVGNEAVEIDVGSYLPGDDLTTAYRRKKVFLTDTLDLGAWAKKENPVLYDYLQKRIYDHLRLPAQPS